MALLAAAWSNQPKLLDFSPAGGAVEVPVSASIQMVFSRAMRVAQVEQQVRIEPATPGKFSWLGNTLTFTPDQVWPNGKQIHLRLLAGARAAAWLSFPMAEQSWSFTTGSENLVYLWPFEGPSELYLLNPATGEIHQLTRGMDVQEYELSRDGKSIYFSANNLQGGSDLYVLDRLQQSLFPGSYQPAMLLVCGMAQCRSPVISPDGQWLAYEYLIPSPQGGLSPAQIWLLSLPSLQASPLGQPTHETVQPAWSSQGWLAFYDRTTQAYILEKPDTDQTVQLSNQTGQPGDWSPDGAYYLAPEIYYSPSGSSSETGSSHLLRYTLQGASSDLSGQELVEDVDAVYSPAGERVAFARKYLDAARWTLGRQMWIMNPDGSKQHPITDEGDYNHYDLSWSLDGTQLAFVRFNQARLSEPPELWMMAADGSQALQLVIGGYSPQWIP